MQTTVINVVSQWLQERGLDARTQTNSNYIKISTEFTRTYINTHTADTLSARHYVYDTPVAHDTMHQIQTNPVSEIIICLNDPKAFEQLYAWLRLFHISDC